MKKIVILILGILFMASSCGRADNPPDLPTDTAPSNQEDMPATQVPEDPTPLAPEDDPPSQSPTDPTSTAEPTSPLWGEGPNPQVPLITVDPTMLATYALDPGGQPPEHPSGIVNLNSVVDRAIQALAEQLWIDVSAITVVEAREVTWSNASLGCPQPGMMYADVLTTGYLVILRGGGIEYEYHANQAGLLVTCENPRPPAQTNP